MIDVWNLLCQHVSEMSQNQKMVMSKDEEEERKGVPMEHQWRLCGGGVNHSKVHGRGKTRMEHQQLCAGVLHHTSGHGRGNFAKTPMENQWLCGAGVVHNKVNGRGKTYPKWVIEEGLKRLTIKRELPSIEDLMLDDAEAREEDMKF